MHDHRSRSNTYDEAFVKAGHGLWQYVLLGLCGWANASDAIEILCVSFILPHIKRDMNVSYASLSSLTFALFFGMMLGGYLWGSLADKYGRKKILCLSLTVNAVCGILSGLCPNYFSLVCFRFLSGLGAGGSLPVCFTYFSEFQQASRRGAMISALAMCWMVGNLLSGLLAWFILPESEHIAHMSPFGQQWRLYTILCGVPSLSSCLLISYLPESPNFLYHSGKYVESLKILTSMYRWNHRGHQTEFGVEKLTYKAGITIDNDGEDATLLETSDLEIDVTGLHSNPRNIQRPTFCASFKKSFDSWKIQMLKIFSPIRRTHSIAVMAISASVAFGGYGMAMWMPVLMARTEKYNGSPCQIHDSNTSNATIGDDSKIYVNILIGFAGQLPGNIAVILLMDRIGSKMMLIYSAFLTSLSVFLFWFINSKASVIAMNTVFNGISVGCWDALDVLLVEIYPTSIRSAASGNACGVSRLGSILGTAIFGVFMDSSCSIPIVAVFIAYAVAGLAGFKLPDLLGKSLL